MDCTEFQEAYHRLLDRKEYLVTEPAMLEHMANCPGCVRFRKQMAFLDRTLRQSAEIERKKKVKLSPEFKRKLRAIPAQKKKERGTQPDALGNGLAWMVLSTAGAIVAVTGAEFASPALAAVLHVGVLTVALAWFLLVATKRLFVGW